MKLVTHCLPWWDNMAPAVPFRAFELVSWWRAIKDVCWMLAPLDCWPLSNFELTLGNLILLFLAQVFQVSCLNQAYSIWRNPIPSSPFPHHASLWLSLVFPSAEQLREVHVFLGREALLWKRVWSPNVEQSHRRENPPQLDNQNKTWHGGVPVREANRNGKNSKGREKQE